MFRAMFAFFFPRTLKLALPILAMVALFFATPSCDRHGDGTRAEEPRERDDPRFKDATGKDRAGLNDEALDAYRELIRTRSDGAPESQFAAGYIYLKTSRPAHSIYHFQEFIRSGPERARKKQVEALIDSARKMLISQLVPGNNGTQAALEKIDELSRLNTHLSRQNNDLKKINADLQRRLANPRVAPVAPPSGGTATRLPDLAVREATPPPPQAGTAVTLPSTYTVAKGDSLFKISTKVYGSAGRWREIYNANRDKLKNDSDLKLGTVLRIPRP
jgi:LysM repeat protein